MNNFLYTLILIVAFSANFQGISQEKWNSQLEKTTETKTISMRLSNTGISLTVNELNTNKNNRLVIVKETKAASDHKHSDNLMIVKDKTSNKIFLPEKENKTISKSNSPVGESIIVKKANN